ncbi:MAG: hypothetical protein WB245_04940 [Acidimicrobiia bacterium]
MASDPPPGDGSIELSLGPYHLRVATGYGPRIIGLRREDGPEVFASLPDSVLVESPLGRYRFRGGHRLWVAPERPEISYAPDEHECEVSVTDESVSIVAPVDAVGLAKEMRVTLDGDGLIVDHGLTRAGTGVFQVGPWAITQLPLGGTAVLPLNGPVETMVTPNRELVLWPYSGLDDRRLSWAENAVLVEATSGPRLKVGSGPAPGSLGYLKDAQLFIKSFTTPGRSLPDRGAVGQVFTNEDFCELESLGAVSDLRADSPVWHRETWRVLACDDLATAVELVTGEDRS